MGFFKMFSNAVKAGSKIINAPAVTCASPKETITAAYQNAGAKVTEIKPEENCAWAFNAQDDRYTAQIICWANQEAADTAEYKYKTKSGIIHARHDMITVCAPSGSKLLDPFRKTAPSLPAWKPSGELYVPPKPAAAPKAAVPDIKFFNEKGYQIGRLYEKKDIMNTSFLVGSVMKTKGSAGAVIYSRMEGGVAEPVGKVADDGSIYDKNGMHVVTQKGAVSKAKAKEAKEVSLGYTIVNGDTGIVYDNNGNKAGEVTGAGEDTIIYGGAMMVLIVRADPKNAPYSQSYKRYEIPKPAIGSTYQDWSESEKIERHKYDIYERLVNKNGLSNALKIMADYNGKADQSADKVSFWEGIRKKVLG